jgi:hypothetical protein
MRPGEFNLDRQQASSWVDVTGRCPHRHSSAFDCSPGPGDDQLRQVSQAAVWETGCPPVNVVASHRSSDVVRIGW